MAHYHIEAPHSEQECMRALDMIVERGMHLLSHTWFGCAVGVHTCWLQLEADTAAEARAVLPPLIAEKAQIVEVQKLTPEIMSTLHQ